MTDNEIIRALECCIRNDGCEQCIISEKCFFLYNKPYVETPEILRLSLDLINRQKAEIERLERLNGDLVKITDTRKKAYFSLLSENLSLTRELRVAKAEAIKEVIEGLKSKKTTAISCDLFEEVVRLSDVESIINEMEGDAK